MRNMRSALWALGLAGATYAWKNRDRLRGQLNALNGGGQRRLPLQLPDNNSQRRIETPQQNSWERPSETKFGGSDV
jgi:hypothetical protein